MVIEYLSTDPALRWSLGGVYVWFEMVKEFGRSPVDSLIHRFYAPIVTVPLYCLLMGFEVLVGFLLVFGWKKKLMSLLVMGHLVGTMCILITDPEIAYVRLHRFCRWRGNSSPKMLSYWQRRMRFLPKNEPGKDG